MTLQKNASISEEKFLYRRQYIIGPQFLDQLPNWQTIELAENLRATVHPDLNCIHKTHATASITLLGYILDPERPEATDSIILDDLLDRLVRGMPIDRLIESTFGYGGRWLLIVNAGHDQILFNDACGYRTLYYVDFSSGRDPWYASQPGLFALVMDLEADPEAQDYLDTDKYNHFGNGEYFFPGDATLYPQIKHLLPNHYLNITSRKAVRYWPDRELTPIGLDECVEICAPIIQNMLLAANHRFDLALSLTSGRDSRVLTAAAKPIVKEIYFFSKFFWNRNEKHADIAVPKALLTSMGLNHHAFDCNPACRPAIEALYSKNVDSAHTCYYEMIQGMYDQLPGHLVWVKGNAIPITKRVYQNKIQSQTVDARSVAIALGAPNQPFAIKEIEKWIQGAQPRYNVELLDLLQWENKEGNWQAYTQLEFDPAVGEIFVPYNCRTLLSTMLSLDPKHRKPPGYNMHNALIQKLWPELLAHPINPSPPASKPSLRVRAKRYFKKRLLPYAGLTRSGRMAAWVLRQMAMPFYGLKELAHMHPKGFVSPYAHIRHSRLKMGSHVLIDDRVTIYQSHGGGNVIIGNRVRLYRDTIIQTGQNGRVELAAGLVIQPRCQFSAYVGSIIIKQGVQIAPNCAFYPYDHGLSPEVPMQDQPLSSKGDIVIDEDAWLGVGVIVLSGVRIGKGAVIGAGSVVSQNIPDMAIAAGIPARIIRMRTDLEYERDGAIRSRPVVDPSQQVNRQRKVGGS